MILTVTLNAALDVTYRVPRLDPHGTHRVRSTTERPGGKGLNVARVLAALGYATAVTGFVGGDTGRAVRALLDAERGHHSSLRDELVTVEGGTRRTLAVVDETTGDTTQFNEAGPEISAQEWEAFLDAYRRLLGEAEAVALCGSLPPGLPVGAYAGLVREARAAKVPVFLDTSGEPLRRGLAARPDLVKPNLAELAEITGSTDPVGAARDARRRGARAVAASLGADGMVLVTEDGTRGARPPRRLDGNPTGAGDSAVAGLLIGVVRGRGWREALVEAVALSTATVVAEAAGEFVGEVYRETLGGVEVWEAE